MTASLPTFTRTPCNSSRSQGQKANHTGATAEATIYCILKERGYRVTRQALVGEDIYGSECRVDFLVQGIPGVETGLIIESKWQEKAGSVDQKYPFLVKNVQERYPYPTMIVHGGNGMRDGSIAWLKNQIDGQKLLAVYSFEEFMSWVMRTL